MAIPPSHLFSVVDRDGAIILDMKSDQFFSLNPVGGYILQRLRQGEGLDKIAKALAEETETEISVVLADVTDFISELKNKRLFDFPA